MRRIRWTNAPPGVSVTDMHASLRSRRARRARTIALHLAAPCAALLALGCSRSRALDELDAGLLVDAGPSTAPADASAPGPDAALDARPPEDAGPPTGGCFAEERTVATHTFDPAGRPHLTPMGIVGRDDGWIVIYAFYSEVHAVYLDLEGGARWAMPLSWPSGSVIGLGPSTLLFTSPLQRFDVERGSAGGRLWSAIEPGDLGAPAGEEEILALDAQPSGLLRALTRSHAVLTASRIVDLELDASSDGLRVVRQQVLPSGALSYEGDLVVRGNRVRTLRASGAEWRSTLDEFEPEALGSGEAFELRRVEDVSWDAAGELLPVGFTSDGRRALTGRYAADGSFEAYLMPIPTGDPRPVGGVVGVGLPRAMIEDEERLGVATDRRLGVFRSDDLAPLAELSFDGIVGGAVHAAQHGEVAAVIFVRETDEPYTVELGVRCMVLPPAASATP